MLPLVPKTSANDGCVKEHCNETALHDAKPPAKVYDAQQFLNPKIKESVFPQENILFTKKLTQHFDWCPTDALGAQAEEELDMSKRFVLMMITILIVTQMANVLP